MFRCRLPLVFVVLLLLFSFYIFLNFVSEKEKATKQYFCRDKHDFIAIKKELQVIKHGMKTIRNEISDLKRAPYRMVSKKRRRILPKWITRFVSPHWTEFKQWRGVFVFFVSYRSEYLAKCLRSVAVASEDIDTSSVCVFALDRTPVTSDREVNETLRVIRNVSFCQVVVWQVVRTTTKEETNFALRLKRHWWAVLESVFNATVNGK